MTLLPDDDARRFECGQRWGWYRFFPAFRNYGRSRSRYLLDFPDAPRGLRFFWRSAAASIRRRLQHSRLARAARRQRRSRRMEMLIDDRPAVVLRVDALRTAKARRAGRQDPSGHGTDRQK